MAQEATVSAWSATMPEEQSGMSGSTGSASRTPRKAPRAEDDPFANGGLGNHQPSQRFSHFDTQRFDLSPSASPAQAKRVLEAHLADTDRRIQDASKLESSLAEQRRNLSEQLDEVRQKQDDSELGPELRQKLADFEAEYRQVVRDSARAFIGSKPHAHADGRGSDGQHSGDASVFSTQAGASPSKMVAPSRRARNQPSNRDNHLRFATEVGASLVAQVRDLQAELAEKDEALRTANLERAQLDEDMDNLKRRLRHLDESEQRCKDENWNLGARVQELTSTAREAADRERRLNQSLSAASAEKNSTLLELDELRQSHNKLVEHQTNLTKQHELELSSLRRNATQADNENSTLQKKVQDLVSQNQELARAVAARAQFDEMNQPGEANVEQLQLPADISTPEGSPPPSPTKGTPRHGMLETETLKSSLHHAHRMIQNLKGNIHREKTEKLELKRMLQDARDEIDIRRKEGGMGAAAKDAAKRRKGGSDNDVFKKPARPSLLGAGRSSTNEILLDEAGWEDHAGENRATSMTMMPPSAQHHPGVTMGGTYRSVDDEPGSNADTTDAFETANEREETATETEAFQTGAESLAGDSSADETETESSVTRGGTLRGSKAGASFSSAGRLTQRDSFMSTASTSADEDDSRGVGGAIPPQQRYRLRVNRGAAYRRSKSGSDFGMFESNSSSVRDSPASISSNRGPVGPNSQTLFAELGELERRASDDGEESVEGTPSRPGLVSRGSTPATRPETARKGSTPSSFKALLLKPIMVDAGTMTEPMAQSNAVVAGVVEEDEKTPTDTVFSKALPVTDHSSQTEIASIDQTQAETQTETLSADATVAGTQTEISSSDATVAGTQTEQPGSDQTVKGRQAEALPRASWTFSPVHHVDIPPIEPAPTVAEDGPKMPEVASTPASPVSVVHDHSHTSTHREILTFSRIVSQETVPVEPSFVDSPGHQQIANGVPRSTEDGAWSPNGNINSKGTTPEPAPGFIGSMFGWAKSQSAPSSHGPSSQAPPRTPERNMTATPDLRMTPGGYPDGTDTASIVDESTAVPGEGRQLDTINEATPIPAKRLRQEMVDESSQTVLSSDQIDSLIKEKFSTPAIQTTEPEMKMGPPPSPTKLPKANVSWLPPRVQEPSVSPARGRSKTTETVVLREELTPTRGVAKRPGSASSMRSSLSAAHPPLPPDHKQAIAAAAQRVSSIEPTTNNGLMGPPMTPSSAAKQQNMPPPKFRTSNIQAQIQSSPNSKAGTTPRAPRHSTARSEVSSVITRRSSISSFASDIDARFNIRTEGGMSMPYGLDGPGTDPRMIQAITQTMIGEYLWKYTRKAGRPEMSDKRHRRFFWVHPYTRTLYWSERDPAGGGRAELKAKSVAIEAVRVIADDNHMPPGLHRKSLVIKTPGRNVVLTATTQLRHDTWFNALSYLLLRTGPEGGTNNGRSGGYEHIDGDGNLTAEDVDEFNPTMIRRNRVGGASGSSFSTRRTSRSRSVSRATSRSRAATAAVATEAATLRSSSATRKSHSMQYQQQQQREQNQLGQDPRHGSISRLSQIFRPTSGLMGTFSSRRSRHSTQTAMTTNDTIPERSTSVNEEGGGDDGHQQQTTTAATTDGMENANMTSDL
ncbi:MAG: hypothetical protein M1823_004104 [Watsoniomyces obsoletus]|nr:MAG: hypothetical protein M1823_004104 [Watsoniomyces obsoletus]